MIIVYAALLGLAVAGVRALRPEGQPRMSPGDRRLVTAGIGLRWWQLAAVALAAQLLLVQGRLATPPDEWRLGVLWATHVVLAAVLAVNLMMPGMRWLLTGMLLNILVMGANGGFMPVSPETLVRGGRAQVLDHTALGEPTRGNKDVLLREEETRFALLSDRLVIPGQRGSFSAGDVLIAAGIVVTLYRSVEPMRISRTPRTPSSAAMAWGAPTAT